MEERFIQAAKGLRILFIAYILAFVAQFLKGNLYGINFGTLLELAGLVLIFWALWTARSAHESYRTAFWANLASLVLGFGSIVGAVLLVNGAAFQMAGLLLGVGPLLMTVTRLVAELFIIYGTGKLLAEKGDRDWAWYAGILWKAILVVEGVAIVVFLRAYASATFIIHSEMFKGIDAVVNMLVTAVGFGLSAFELVVFYHSFQTLPKPSAKAAGQDT